MFTTIGGAELFRSRVANMLYLSQRLEVPHNKRLDLGERFFSREIGLISFWKYEVAC